MLTMTDSASLILFHPQSLSLCHLTCFLRAGLCTSTMHCTGIQSGKAKWFLQSFRGQLCSDQKSLGEGMMPLSSLDIKLHISGSSFRQNGCLYAGVLPPGLGVEIWSPATPTPFLNLQEVIFISFHAIHHLWQRDKDSRSLLSDW